MSIMSTLILWVLGILVSIVVLYVATKAKQDGDKTMLRILITIFILLTIAAVIFSGKD
jgi:heme/copper-type cytochrome/quinol oxidase subunit 2